MRGVRARDFKVVVEEHKEDRNRSEAGPQSIPGQRQGTPIPAQVSLLRVCWKEEQVKTVKCGDLSAKWLFLKLVSPEVGGPLPRSSSPQLYHTQSPNVGVGASLILHISSPVSHLCVPGMFPEHRLGTAHCSSGKLYLCTLGS